MKSSSSSQSIRIYAKLSELSKQFALLTRSRAPWRTCDFSFLQREYDRLKYFTDRHAAFSIEGCNAFEIGCGQRPYRLLYYRHKGINALGVDMDKVVFSANPLEILKSLRRNGLERTAKTYVRFFLFDIAENRQLKSHLQIERWPLDKIKHGTAANAINWPDQTFDLIYSDAVFEHIPKQELEKICALMVRHMHSESIAVISPMVFTGIKGGHNVEWYNVDTSGLRQCPPWDHLRENRYPANTYLNKMWLRDYHEMFSRYFHILKADPLEPDLGREFLTDELRQELSNCSEDELFSNKVSFVLKPKAEHLAKG
jgi:hypothetical protein